MFWLPVHVWDSPSCILLVRWEVGEGIPSLWEQVGQ